MDTVQHGFWGVYITGIILSIFGLFVFNIWTIILFILSWLIGASLDLVRLVDKKHNYEWNGWYKDAHRADEGIWKKLKLIPHYYTHWKLDIKWHHHTEEHGKTGWKPWGILLDIIMWIWLVFSITTLFLFTPFIISLNFCLFVIFIGLFDEVSEILDNLYGVKKINE